MFIPHRTDIQWEYFGPSGPHPEIEGVCGRRVRIIQEKNLSKFEKFLSALMKAPTHVNRDLDDLNSLMWELMDGNRNFVEIIELMDSTFHERMIPTTERSLASIDQLVNLGYVTIDPLVDDNQSA